MWALDRKQGCFSVKSQDCLFMNVTSHTSPSLSAWCLWQKADYSGPKCFPLLQIRPFYGNISALQSNISNVYLKSKHTFHYVPRFEVFWNVFTDTAIKTASCLVSYDVRREVLFALWVNLQRCRSLERGQSFSFSPERSGWIAEAIKCRRWSFIRLHQVRCSLCALAVSYAHYLFWKSGLARN